MKQKIIKPVGKKIENSEKGFLTVQFMIALMISLFFIISFLGLTLTLTHSSLTQYLTYVAARKTALGGKTAGDQEDKGKEKYKQLRDKFFGSSFQSGGSDWFVISSDTEMGFNPAYNSQEDGRPGARRLFYGSFVEFKSNITNFQIPGLTSEESGDLKTPVGSYLGREPSEKECDDYFLHPNTKNRLKDYETALGGRLQLTNFFTDNGC